MDAGAPPKTPPESVAAPEFASPRVTVDHHGEDGVVAIPSPKLDPPRSPGFVSPLRQHKRTPSFHREVKETLDARVEFCSDDTDGRTHHRINQYTIHDEIGRGSYGAVHKATDQYGVEYAIKEFSKTRLRKRAQSNILRQGPHRFPQRGRPNAGSPLGASPRIGSLRARESNDALYLIREEMAIMMKLNHPNLVQLIEVLDDPEEDSLYMVMEMCHKGVIMKVDLESQATPYSEDECRCWFRDLILGIEYLHAQGVIHRDIKPDNLLISSDDVLKVVDFGVSEMFQGTENMKTAKSAGSPAFLPPELCGKHTAVEGTAADVWSMGVTLYCLRYGRIPFNRDGMLEVYEAIKHDEPQFPADENPDLVDLLKRLLEKDPEKRIKMPKLREHPWVTDQGNSPLLSTEENCAKMVEPPNELELKRAITPKMNHLLYVMKVIHRLKSRLAVNKLKQEAAEGSVSLSRASTMDEIAMTEEIEALLAQRRQALKERSSQDTSRPDSSATNHNEPLILGIGTGSRDAFAMDDSTPDVVADSPTAVDFNVYDRAYQDAIERYAHTNPSSRPTMYLTKFVKEKDCFKGMDNLIDGSETLPSMLADTVKYSAQRLQQSASPSTGKLAHMVTKLGVSEETKG